MLCLPCRRNDLGPRTHDRLRHDVAGSDGGLASALPLEEALPIATQIAEALETAHDQGSSTAI
jgi:hypothetical protein